MHLWGNPFLSHRTSSGLGGFPPDQPRLLLCALGALLATMTLLQLEWSLNAFGKTREGHSWPFNGYEAAMKSQAVAI